MTKKRSTKRRPRSSPRPRRTKVTLRFKADPTPKPLSDDKTVAAKKLFLDAHPHFYSVANTAKAIGIHRDTHYHWMRTDSVYATGYSKAKAEALDLLKGKIHSLALRGNLTALIVQLKAMEPDTYNRKQVEHVGAGGGPIQIENVDAAKASLTKKISQLAARAAANLAVAPGAGAPPS